MPVWVVDPEYGDVPPDADTVTEVVPPWQTMAAPCEDDAVSADAGCVMVAMVVTVQLLLSVTV